MAVDWTAVSAIATMAGAVVGAGAAAIISWQAVETRRAVQVARESLDLARRAEAQTIKGRLDARAPRLRVLTGEVENQPVRAWGGFGEPQPWPVGEVLRQPKNDQQQFVVGASFTVINDGDRSEQVAVSGWVNETSYRGRLPEVTLNLVLGPGDQHTFSLREMRPLSEWVENYPAWKAGQPTPHVVFGEMICSDPFDEGVIDNWRLEVYCYPFEPVPDEHGAWRARERPNSGQEVPSVVSALAHPQHRRYFLSKQNGHLLEPEPGTDVAEAKPNRAPRQKRRQEGRIFPFRVVSDRGRR